MKKILFGILAIFLLAVIGTVSAAPVISGTIPSQTRNEDCLPWELDLSDYESGNAIPQETDEQLTWSVSGVDTINPKFTVTPITIDPVLDLITFTPVANAFGSDTITLTLTNGTASVTQDIVVTLTSVNDNPIIVGTISSQTKVEDSAAWTLDLTSHESDVEDSGTKLTWSVSGVDTTKFSAVVTDSLTDVITFTPVANAIGSDEITLTLADSNGGTATRNIIVTLTSNGNDDAPVSLQTIPDQKWIKGTSHTLDLKGYLFDADDISTVYTWEPITLNDITVSVLNGVATFTPKVNTWKGTNTINFTISDGVHTSVTSNNLKLVVREEPDYMCEEGIKKDNLEIESVEDPDSGDNFKPGETINIKVKVKNSDEDEIDTVVKAFLYDETDDDVVANIESDTVTIQDGDDETIEFDLEIPTDEDLDEGDTYSLYLKAYEDGQEDDNCDESSAIEIDIERDKDDVTISKFEITPTSVNPGETVEFTIIVDNIGTNDQDDITVKLVEIDLGLNLVSETFDLDKATDSDHDNTIRFTFTVPSNVASKAYSIAATVYDEDDDAYDNGEEFATLTISGSAVVEKEEVDLSVLSTIESVEAGKSYSLPVKVTNNKAVQDTLTVKLTNIDDWATSTSQKVLTLKAGQSETVYLYLKANEQIGEGKYSATVQVTDSTGKVVGTETVTLGAKEGETSWNIFGDIGGSKLFWIIGDIILVIVAIFFIKLIFSGKRKPVKEVRL